MNLLNKAVLVFLLLSAFTCSAGEKDQLSYEILKPIIKLMRSGEIYKASLPTYNQYRQKQGKQPLTYEDLKPLFDKTAEISEGAYLKYFSEEFSLDELSFMKDLFSTDVGKEIFAKLTQSITTGVPHKPDLRQFNSKQIALFNSVASNNIALSQGFASRVQKVNMAVQKHAAEEFKKYPELKALISQ